jgi:transcriptional accessory protein Tex/SPT6
VQTLDGRVPTVDELKQRKHVLKRALQKEDRVKDQLKAQGREYPPDKQQQWVQMYTEYKEIKQVLQAVEEAEAAERDADGGGGGSGRQQGGGSAVIDLT